MRITPSLLVVVHPNCLAGLLIHLAGPSLLADHPDFLAVHPKLLADLVRLDLLAVLPRLLVVRPGAHP